jgi:hypothetical protein
LGFEYAGAISLMMAKVKVDDDSLDQGGLMSSLESHVINSGVRAAVGDLTRMRFDPRIIPSEMKRQRILEGQNCSDLDELTSPTENAVSEIFAHTAALTDMEANFAPLSKVGRNVGRLMYLVDSYVDMAEDSAKGRFNALSNCCSQTGAQLREKMRRLSSQSIGEISSSMRELRLSSHGGIVKEAMVASLKRRLDFILGTAGGHPSCSASARNSSSAPVSSLPLPGILVPLRCSGGYDPCGGWYVPPCWQPCCPF